jgi:ribose 5-phosphate isomerase A
VAASGAYEFSPARSAAARAATDLIEPGMTVGLGSGRAVWTVVDAIGGKWPMPPIRAAVASQATFALAHLARIEVIELDGETPLDIAIDGADEIDSRLRLLKGGGGALLREKIVAHAASRFVVVAEKDKMVERLGERFKVPVEVVRFGWRDTQRRLGEILPDSERRTLGGDPFLTDETHYILDCPIPPDADVEELAERIDQVPGVVEHGLFLHEADRVLIGTPEGGLDVLER